MTLLFIYFSFIFPCTCSHSTLHLLLTSQCTPGLLVITQVYVHFTYTLIFPESWSLLFIFIPLVFKLFTVLLSILIALHPPNLVFTRSRSPRPPNICTLSHICYTFLTFLLFIFHFTLVFMLFLDYPL